MRHSLFSLLLCVGLSVAFPLAAKPHVHPAPKVLSPPSVQVPALPRVPVMINANVGKNDQIGALLLQALRSRLVVSPRLSLAPAEAGTGLEINLVTLNPVQDGSATVYGEAFTIRRRGQPTQYVSSTVAVCGSDRVRDCAEGMENEIIRLVDRLIQTLRTQAKPSPSTEVYEI